MKLGSLKNKLFVQKDDPKRVTTITQQSLFSIVNFNSFSLHKTRFINIDLPSDLAVILITQNSGKPTIIDGEINSNGTVFISNPFGVIIRKNARLNIKNLVVTNLICDESAFVKGVFKFNSDGKHRMLSIIKNNSAVNLKEGGSIVLLKDSRNKKQKNSCYDGSIREVWGDSARVHYKKGRLNVLEIDGVIV